MAALAILLLCLMLEILLQFPSLVFIEFIICIQCIQYMKSIKYKIKDIHAGVLYFFTDA